jgi:hypothetical protein
MEVWVVIIPYKIKADTPVTAKHLAEYGRDVSWSKIFASSIICRATTEEN